MIHPPFGRKYTRLRTICQEKYRKIDSIAQQAALKRLYPPHRRAIVGQVRPVRQVRLDPGLFRAAHKCDSPPSNLGESSGCYPPALWWRKQERSDAHTITTAANECCTSCNYLFFEQGAGTGFQRKDGLTLCRKHDIIRAADTLVTLTGPFGRRNLRRNRFV